jgi:hypothetical protein
VKKHLLTLACAALLASPAPTGANTLRLYEASMASSSLGGIDFVASNAAGSKCVVKSGFASKPVSYVSLYDSLRFANWLHNGQGAYTGSPSEYGTSDQGGNVGEWSEALISGLLRAVRGGRQRLVFPRSVVPGLYRPVRRG